MSTKSVQADSLWHQFKALSEELVDVLLPPVCAGCGKVGDLVCPDCKSLVEWVRDPICYACGKPSDIVVGLCRNCSRHPLQINQIRAAALHVDPVKRILHLMKYEGYFALADPLSDIMMKAWARWQMPVDVVIPIPLHAERKRQRGYNQAELLVNAMRDRLQWTVVPEALRRHKRTTPQVGLTITQRQQNVRNAFSAERNLVKGKRILLVDDVCTTGSTLDSAARVLIEAGAQSVCAYCLTTVSNSYNVSYS